MPIRFRCPFCDQLLSIARRKAGTVIQCPKCIGDIVVPGEDEPAASEPSVPPPEPAYAASSPLPDWVQDALPPAPSPPPSVEPAPPPAEPPVPTEVPANFAKVEPPGEEPIVPLRRRRPPKYTGWRLASPTFLFGALMMAFLPWLEARSRGLAGQEVVESQTGFQVVLGGVTAVDRDAKDREKLGGVPITKCPSCGRTLQVPPDTSSWMPARCPQCGELFNPSTPLPMPLAPLVGIFLSLVASGMLSGFIIRSVTARLVLGGSLALGALTVLAVQALQGFPLERVLRAASASDSVSRSLLAIHYTPGLWGTVFMLLIALALLGLEFAAGAASLPRRD